MTNSSTATKGFYHQIDELIMAAFGFTFEKWHDKGLWTDDYERYSIIENGVMLSNISAYKMKLLINGVPRDFIQLGSVATLQEHRGKGLARQLMEHILNKYPDTPIFLFGDNDAEGYYRKMGFTPFSYKQPYIDCRLCQSGDMKRLEVTDPKVDRYLKERSQHSQILDCLNQYAINWFHLLYRFSKHIYEIPELDVMLIAKQAGSILTIYDMVSKASVSFAEIIPHLHFDGVERIEFGFNPDWLSIEYQMTDLEDEDGIPFIKGDFGLKTDFAFPTMIAT